MYKYITQSVIILHEALSEETLGNYKCQFTNSPNSSLYVILSHWER